MFTETVPAVHRPITRWGEWKLGDCGAAIGTCPIALHHGTGSKSTAALIIVSHDIVPQNDEHECTFVWGQTKNDLFTLVAHDISTYFVSASSQKPRLAHDSASSSLCQIEDGSPSLMY
ncbi:MAG: hypothetical protein A3A30_04880 [Candidatus Terrybacteria bacterium RIFCSPLOWO2_01_FULL_48_14]|nr:MAG: hypothetical protein A3A30_04880 [Candidatus Terrybacteria bacterium RIFCSPLOWO2_01_FULL_48_14]